MAPDFLEARSDYRRGRQSPHVSAGCQFVFNGDRINMKYAITIPEGLERVLRSHLFQNELEQGAFLFAQPLRYQDELRLEAVDVYLIRPSGWQVQLEVYLEMKDAERAKIMKIAKDRDLAVIDCHSHPGSDDDVWFSPSDKRGISEFAAYVKWKLGGKPFTAMVWGESSVDAVGWHDSFEKASKVEEVRILGDSARVLAPRGTWFRRAPSYWKKSHE